MRVISSLKNTANRFRMADSNGQKKNLGPFAFSAGHPCIIHTAIASR
jgi:hypothetical protein